MHPLKFPCPTCGKRMGVGLDLAGKSVRCPHCQKVLTAPQAAKAPAARPTPPDRESVESIFGDPEEAEDAVFGGRLARKVQLPPMPTRTPPAPANTAQQTSVTEPDQWLTADEVPSSVIIPALDNIEESDFSAAGPVSSHRRPTPATAIPWKLVAVALAIYSVILTLLAAWGWLR